MLRGHLQCREASWGGEGQAGVARPVDPDLLEVGQIIRDADRGRQTVHSGGVLSGLLRFFWRHRKQNQEPRMSTEEGVLEAGGKMRCRRWSYQRGGESPCTRTPEQH